MRSKPTPQQLDYLRSLGAVPPGEAPKDTPPDEGPVTRAGRSRRPKARRTAIPDADITSTSVAPASGCLTMLVVVITLLGAMALLAHHSME